MMKETYSLNLTEPFAVYDHDTSSWRTFQESLPLENTKDTSLRSLKTSIKVGTMRNGVLSKRPMLVQAISGSDGSVSHGDGTLLTPTKRDYKGVRVHWWKRTGRWYVSRTRPNDIWSETGRSSRTLGNAIDTGDTSPEHGADRHRQTQEQDEHQLSFAEPTGSGFSV